jgi:hypothetical protein
VPRPTSPRIGLRLERDIQTVRRLILALRAHRSETEDGAAARHRALACAVELHGALEALRIKGSNGARAA